MKKEFQVENEKFLAAYIVKMPHKVNFSPLYPKERNEEIEKTNHEDLRRQRFCVWKLLEYAIFDVLGRHICDFEFKKEESGKWCAEGLYFSLSHSENALMVAISSHPVGVDIEFIHNPRSAAFAKRILTESECEEYERTEDKFAYVIKKWTQREAVYKRSGVGVFSPRRINCDGISTFTDIVKIEKDEYAFTVAADAIEYLKIAFDESLNKTIF